MVGLPYPNPRDPVLVEKMKYISTKAAASASSSSSSSSSSPRRSTPALSARQYYENACMRAVNQSIGRSIRHAGDYATILLVDNRYMRPEITSKLPRWISTTMPKYPIGDRAIIGLFFNSWPIHDPHRNSEDAPSRAMTFGQAFGHVRAFFQEKRENQLKVENERKAAREENKLHVPGLVT
jgi:hypothetical protein